MDVSYGSIASLIATTADQPSYVEVVFRCSVTGTEVRAEGQWPDDGVVGTQVKQARRTLFSSVRNSIAQSVRRSAGSSLLGQIGGAAAANAVQMGSVDFGERRQRSDRDRERATVAAFTSVQNRFRWDGDRWVASGAAQVETSAFDDQLRDHPVPEGYDQDLVTRLLAALVAADGSIGEDERESFAALAPGADLDALVARRPPGSVDFEEARLGPSRDTILLLGWAVALSDESLDQAEADLLDAAARGLGISPEHAAELRTTAQRHIITQAVTVLAGQGMATDEIRTQAEDLGERIGLGAEEAARVVIRWSKRGS